MTKGIRDLLYVRFSLQNLPAQQQFLEDFGTMTEITNNCLLARGSDGSRYHYVAEQGEDNQFVGMGFEAESMADLERIAAIDDVEVEPITDLPGDGYRARLTDPDGFAVDIVYGIQTIATSRVSYRNPINTGDAKARVGERAQLPELGHVVKRLGHCVINVTDFSVSEAWYKERIGFITSDEVYMGEEGKSLGAFLRVNRGDVPVDHHTLFLVGAGAPGFNHAAYEVNDWDTLMQGHDVLRDAEYVHKWGVGKHLLGSQVFDYWQDPNGFTLEHFTDGDLFNESFGSHKQPIEKLLGVHWGPAGSP